MGELFLNKIAGGILCAALLVVGLNHLSESFFHAGGHGDESHGPAYEIELASVGGSGAAPADEGPLDLGLLFASADVSAGENSARKCLACHSFDKGGAAGTGPNLWGIVGREIGSVAGFGYSSAMAEYGAANGRWGFENLYAYLERPAGEVRGTSMSFIGIRKQEERINLISYLRSLADAPIDFPAPLEAAGAAVDGVQDAAAELVENVTDAAENALDAVPDGATDPGE